ncbi:hypothetical protein [Aquibacillus albus]|uniref:Uncharacterized protein n=1 Tax=Aquibacillus albus TaxID=1168171 RepID=A0ABS2MW37_9BACI|nr:hypothetical protein [Aquibacillus albus]MBM7570111.1 hypothetical protein [Aquibacillus albus]
MNKLYIDENNKIVITPQYPSYLLADFITYLTYLKTHQIKLTRTKGYFSKKDLLAIYSKMKSEKKEVPSNATQTGYPIVHLFYHLSIVLDFIRVHYYKSSAVALVQDEQIEKFVKLTATEQYVTLLEAFWIEADWHELQGEKRMHAPYNIDFLFKDLEEIPANEELDLNEMEEINSFVIDYGQFFYYFSYFGFWEFEINKEKSNQPNRPKRTFAKSIRLTPFFKKIQDALLETWEPHHDEAFEESLNFFANLFVPGYEVARELDTDEAENTESLVDLLSPLFPKVELTTIIKAY